MASSSKTGILGLNAWKETDRPKRSDFVADNNIIDSVLGAHAQNASIHLTESERQKLDSLSEVYQYAGTGEASKSFTLPFAPSFVFLFKKGDAPFSEGSGYTNVNFAYAAASGGSSGGLSLSGTSITVTQSTAAQNGAFYNLNKQYSQYIALLLR